jgi:acyl-CoA thioester hydrolase
VFFQHHDVHARPGQEKSKHNAGRAATHDATGASILFQTVSHGSNLTENGRHETFFPLDIFYHGAKICLVMASVYKHQHRVTYGECTVGNHVYYSRYLEMLEGARGEFFRHLGCPFLGLQEAGTVFPVIGLQISYKGAARYDDLLTIELCVNELGGVRLNCGFRILNAGGIVLAEGETRHVCASVDEKPKRLPKDLIEKLQPFLQAKNYVA